MNTIVSDGRKRLERSDEHRAKLRALRLEIEARYARGLSSVRILERVVLRVQMRLEFRRERAKLEPSHSTLFLGR